MTKEIYKRLEDYMLKEMDDSAHDAEHIYRVLYTALDIAQTEPGADLDVLIAACLLHDIGRAEQLRDPSLCHAQVGGEKAYRFLCRNGFDESFAGHVRACIRTHRFRSDAPPQSLEAKILFDADKLDAAGACGIARTLLYQGEVSAPLYTRMADGTVSNGAEDGAESFFHEYRHKLEKIYDGFYTARGAALAGKRRSTAESFYKALLAEVQEPERAGRDILRNTLR